jgi:hypothetical protein
MAFSGLLATTPVYADSEHKAKPTASRDDREAVLRHTMRDEINTGLLGIVSEGTDYTADLALSLAGEKTGLRLLPIAGAGALQNAKDVMFARGIDFGIVQTDVLDEIKRNPPFPPSKSTCNTSPSSMIKTFMCWPDLTSSRSTI